MHNRDVSHAWAYHNKTKHSEWSIRTSPHYLDFDIQPIPFKLYNTLQPLPLPREAEQTGVAALSAIAQPSVPRDRQRLPTLSDLARILYFSAGITKLKQFPGGEIYFRAASCTGALYEFELYVVCGSLPDLEAGVYHFGPQDFSLRLLRSGDFRGNLSDATSGEPAVSHAPATIICTGTYWRNAWKYRTRTYRHFGWDNGTLLANLLAMCNAVGLSNRVVMGFADSEVNRLLDLDEDREVTFSLVPIGSSNLPAGDALEVGPLNLPTLKPDEEVDYPELREIHAASTLSIGEEVREWRCSTHLFDDTKEWLESTSRLREDQSHDSIEQVILRRGSSRRFKREPISLDQLQTMLQSSTGGIESDFLESSRSLMNDLYLIVNAVEGLSPGAYFYRPKDSTLELLKTGDFRSDAQYLGLDQALPGDASAAVFFMADLNPILERFGNRGYRAVQTEAGIIGGKLYLSAYAQRLGATGLTFFDDDVTAFFSPHAAGKSAIFLIALGKGERTKTV